MEEVIKKALEKAWKNGYKGYMWVKDHPQGFGVIWANSNQAHIPIIFDHDFAKAFWGITPRRCKACGNTEGNGPEEAWCVWCDGGNEDQPNWEHELREMVISEDPIKYLESFI